MKTRPEEQKDYFQYPVGALQHSACSYCIHKRKGATCAAFSGGDEKSIPIKVLRRKNDHLEPIPGDNGIQFEGREGWELPTRLQP